MCGYVLEAHMPCNLKLHCDEKQGLENAKYALYIMCHPVAVNIKLSLGAV
jgi:hypothetical protein